MIYNSFLKTRPWMKWYMVVVGIGAKCKDAPKYEPTLKWEQHPVAPNVVTHQGVNSSKSNKKKKEDVNHKDPLSSEENLKSRSQQEEGVRLNKKITDIENAFKTCKEALRKVDNLRLGDPKVDEMMTLLKEKKVLVEESQKLAGVAK